MARWYLPRQLVLGSLPTCGSGSDLPYSDADPSRVEPSHNTEAVSVATEVATEYRIEIPEQGEYVRVTDYVP